jgi:uroporphyrinogen decarboxylase
MTPRQRFLAAIACQPLDRPPLWIMRQAGRYLPEYRALKERHSFVEMVRTPELATEVTLQPLRRFPLDAAILFSDILVVPEALGQAYHFRDGGGIAMAFALDDPARLEPVDEAAFRARLDYIPQALRLIRAQLGPDHAMLGFGGSPWTLAAYMVEGGSSAAFARLVAMASARPDRFTDLMERLTWAVTLLFRMQIEAGVDAIQIFDSWGAACPGASYAAWSLQWIRRIIAALPEGFPVILFAKGMAHQHRALAATGARVLSFDSSVDLAALRAELPAGLAVQGNLEPTLLTLEPDIVRHAARTLLGALAPSRGHICNLGHGITPQARIDAVAALVETVHTAHA